MNEQKWYQISLNIDIEKSELISDFFIEQGSDGVFLDKEQLDENNQTNLKAYFSDEFTDIDILADSLKNKLKEINADSHNVVIKEVEEEQWVDNSQEYFQVFKTGEKLVFKPIWQEYQANNNEIVIDFDPGSFFGVTPHPSTKLCLEEIETIALSLDKNAQILDLGTGSGILSLALFHLGYKNIEAIDIDPVAIRSSEDNFVLNKMDIPLALGGLELAKNMYDLIAGNLLAETISELAQEISEKLNKNGIFIGAGITRNQEENTIEILKKHGMDIESSKYSNEWVLIKAVKI